jgi:enoyl-CoA hydratase
MDGPGVSIDVPLEGVLRLRLNRPEKRNAVDRPLVTALLDALDGIDAGAIVLGSHGPAFCSGLDLSLEPTERVEVSDLLYELCERIVTLPVPVVAAIGGPAVGGGAQLAIASDLRVAGPQAQIRLAGPGHGLAVGAWGLPSLVGRGRAMDLCLSMRPVSADEALRIGLADRLDENPEGVATNLAGELARLDRPAAARIKRIVGGCAGLLEALRRERRENREAWSGDIADPGRGAGHVDA